MISLSSADRRTSLGGLILDLTLTEELTFQSEVSQYPVEAGVTISDHVTQGAETVRISGTIPTADVLAYETDQEGRAKVIDVVEQLRRMHAARETLIVSTGQLVYAGFAFTQLTATRTADAEGGNWLSISAELTHVRKVELRTAEVPAESRVSNADGARGRSGKTNKPGDGQPRQPRSAAAITADALAGNTGEGQLGDLGRAMGAAVGGRP